MDADDIAKVRGLRDMLDAIHFNCNDGCDEEVHSFTPAEQQVYREVHAIALAVLAPLVEQAKREGAAEALRRFADSRGVNVGDEDDDYWRGYRQAQRECLHDATACAERAAQTPRDGGGS